jgi:hypothetical protein
MSSTGTANRILLADIASILNGVEGQERGYKRVLRYISGAEAEEKRSVSRKN